jgi:hypothetical protein
MQKQLIQALHKGTCITVELMGSGRTFADLLDAYPALTIDDIRAGLAIPIAAAACVVLSQMSRAQAR